MQIQTRKFGHVEFTLEEVVVMPEGLLDFPNQRRWLILADEGHDSLFWLQSLDVPELALAVASPQLLEVAALGGLTAKELAELQEDAEGDLVAVARLLRTSSGLSLDVERPILINVTRRIGRQFAGVSVSSAPSLPAIPSRQAA